MNIKTTLVIIAFLIFITTNFAQERITIVPHPKEIKLNEGELYLDEVVRVGFKNQKVSAVADLMAQDLYKLYQIRVKAKEGKADIFLDIDNSLAEEEFNIIVTKANVTVKGGSYNAVCMGVTSVLQLAKPKKAGLIFPLCEIKDKPTSEYRGVMLDVARQWHSIETVKQVVELCRWYKIRYLQIHLTDDQSFTFPSTTYPNLPTKGRHYSLDELKYLVDFATKRGVVIIPEFDAPGHTTAMRKAMPELFGPSNLGVVDMTKDEVYRAMETIMKEMMDVFYTSPYFHIGGDEAWLGEFQKKEATKAHVAKNDFDNAHDVYLDFLVKMHEVVKKHGKKTLVWESFSGEGSRKVKIPKDMIVFAWETAYQRPESLLKNGYTIINASWKPAYVTPGWRWTKEYIYNWNLHRWENHWNATPAYFNPIQLDKSTPILGGQLCSWEMSEEEQIASIHKRVSAISEVFWNGEGKKSYEDYNERAHIVDDLYTKLIFPVNVEREGFNEPEYEGIYFNRENEFSDKAKVKFKPILADTKLTYTTDGSMPTFSSPQLPKVLELDNNFSARIGVFNSKGLSIGYKVAKYEVNAIKSKIVGDTIPLRDINSKRNRVEFIDEVELELKNLKDQSEIRYTTDGSRPTMNSKRYQGNVLINSSMDLKASCFFDGVPYGKLYENKFVKKNYEKNITTAKKIVAVDRGTGSGINLDKAIDGFVDIDGYWDNSNEATSVIIDLDQETVISSIQLYTYWDGNRVYGYTVEASVNGKDWELIVDRTSNGEVATENGYIDEFTKTKAKFIRVNMLSNTANSSMHIVEVRAY
ncbi:family 20 glycosylhydrolase [Arenibacter aquaticus]|nr:family 20 glycosylhydrolase [Arenibacter aquaticus]